ncbi:hypothetical protein SEUCBS140593_003133 [Sporothrix eucalyptigena]|uniref:Glutamyl-tRNA(Gln) amidotransferase subunit B, mitochondrial n=1 Tax=Sporothrix eucalyptigena TaxID=1812306 RepID=A0ABP0BD76_9PEZI
MTTPPPPSPKPLPVSLRKQMKEEAKARKAQARAGSPVSTVNRDQTVPGWELTVGIEIHAQLNTDRKLFSDAAVVDDTDPVDPNTTDHVAYFDLSLPGAQPIFQPATLVPALRAALALHCTIQPVSRFDRKHYFHWDQPSGYQITQYYEPFARGGYVELLPRDGIYGEEPVRVELVQVQMEQDTAKTVAQPGGVHWLDFSRVGVPLVEIISAPQMHHPATAAAYVRKVQALLHAVNACTSGMEAGGLRADVNVSVRRATPDGEPIGELGVRTEIKNLNSFRAVEDAIIAERNRQIAAIEAAEAAGHPDPPSVIESETRGWTPAGAGEGGQTHRLRGKEGAVDYRYMPDPDLGPVLIGEDLVQYLEGTLGVLPDEELDRLVEDYGLSGLDATALMALDGGGRAQYYYDVVDAVEAKLGTTGDVAVRAFVANWVLHQLGKLTAEKAATEEGVASSLEMTPEGRCRVPVTCLADILAFRYQGRITAGVAKDLLFSVFYGDVTDVEKAIDKSNLWFDEIAPDEYTALAEEALEGEAKTLKQFLAPKKYPQGKLQYLVGKLLRSGPEGRTDPQNAEAAVRAAIERWVEANK